MRTLRVATFMRASTNKQGTAGQLKKAKNSKKKSVRPVDTEDDLPLQKKMIEEFVNSQPEASNGIRWEFTGLEYVEAGVSGFHTHVSKRVGLNHALEDAKADKFDILVLYKLDRFGRRSIESNNHAVKFLRYCRIWVVDKKREFTNNGSSDEILNFIEFWSAKDSSVKTKERVTDAMNLIHKDGYWTGGNPPYGYINHPEVMNMLQVVPHEAEIVKEIYRLYTSEGLGMLRIAGILNERGEKTKTGREWKAENIRKILRNTIYKGYLSYGKSKIVDGEFGSYQQYTPEGTEHVSDRYWEEYDLVGSQVWEKAQNLKKQRVNTDNLFGRKTPNRSRTGKGLLVGILKCQCGSNMTYGTSSDWLDSKRTKKGEPYGIYRCLRRLKSGVVACGAEKGSYKAKELEEHVVEKVEAYIQQMITSNVLEEIKKKTLENSQSVKEKLENAKHDLERWTKIKENANAELMKILAGQDSFFSPQQLKETYENAVRELEKAENLYRELENVKKSEGVNEIDVLKLQDVLKEWSKLFTKATQEEKRQMIQSIASEITLAGTDVAVEIDFNVAKFFEAISSARETACTLENTYLQNGDYRSSNGKYIASIEELLGGTDNTSFIKKLGKTFPTTIRDTIRFSA